MSNKYFTAFAKEITKIKDDSKRKRMAIFVADIYSSIHRRFNWGDFMLACNVKGGIVCHYGRKIKLAEFNSKEETGTYKLHWFAQRYSCLHPKIKFDFQPKYDRLN